MSDEQTRIINNIKRIRAMAPKSMAEYDREIAQINKTFDLKVANAKTLNANAPERLDNALAALADARSAAIARVQKPAWDPSTSVPL